MTKEELRKFVKGYFDNQPDEHLQHFVEHLYPLIDDPAPTLPGNPRAVAIADDMDRTVTAWRSMLGGELPEAGNRMREIAAILRRAPAPGITLDEVERWMREAWAASFKTYVADYAVSPIDDLVAAMRRELGPRT